MMKKIIIYPAIGLFALVVLTLIYQIIVVANMNRTLDKVPEGYGLGPEKADISLVEFAIYTCPHCREVHETVLKAVKEDGNVRYVPRPLPSGQIGDAQMAYAAGLQGKFMMAHSALLTDGRILDEGGLTAIGEMIGLDIEKLETDMKNGEVIDKVNHNIALFRELGGTHTPTFVIDKKRVFIPEGQMPSVQDFLDMFAEARK